MKSAATILMIDDQPSILQSLKLGLTMFGYQVLTAHDGVEALTTMQSQSVDLIVADITMPRMNGYELYEQVRKEPRWATIPFLFLTARALDSDIRYGKQLGVDDYLIKPINLQDLHAAVQGKLRRAEQLAHISAQSAPAAPKQAPGVYHDDYLSIDLDQRQVLVRGQPANLTPTEYRLLAYLFENAGRVLTFKQILGNVWGWEYQDNADYVHVYISHLRRKLEKDSRHPEYLLTEHGVGYRFEKLAR